MIPSVLLHIHPLCFRGSVSTNIGKSVCENFAFFAKNKNPRKFCIFWISFVEKKLPNYRKIFSFLFFGNLFVREILHSFCFISLNSLSQKNIAKYEIKISHFFANIFFCLKLETLFCTNYPLNSFLFLTLQDVFLPVCF